MTNKVQELWWEENKTRVWQVEVDNGNYVARRQDNDQINGTKLLNITKITRGKRDGILKNEKSRQVVKTGTITLKGVWIPFERAIILARQFNIEQQLYPLFETNLGDYVENSIGSHQIKRKSLNNLMDSLTTNRELVSKRRSTVSTYNPATSAYVSPFGFSPQHCYQTEFEDMNQHSGEIQPGRPRNTSSASDWMTNWSTSSSSPVIPATPNTFSPVMNTFQSLALHSPPIPIPNYYYDSSSSYFPSYHQKQQQQQVQMQMQMHTTASIGGDRQSNEYIQR